MWRRIQTSGVVIREEMPRRVCWTDVSAPRATESTFTGTQKQQNGKASPAIAESEDAREVLEREPSVPLQVALELHTSASPAAARVSPETVKQDSRAVSEEPSEVTEAAEDNEPANRTRTQASIKKGMLIPLTICIYGLIQWAWNSFSQAKTSRTSNRPEKGPSFGRFGA